MPGLNWTDYVSKSLPMAKLRMHIKQTVLQKKSRLAGFFLCVILLGCEQPAPPPAGALALQQAQSALAQGLPLKATELLELSIQQGNAAAVMLWLTQTSQQLGSLSQWQRLQELGMHQLPAEAYQQLGLWQQVSSARPQLQPIATAACQLKVQPVLASAVAVSRWQQFTKAWPTSAFAQLPLCFLPPQVVDTAQLACTEQVGKRVQCDEESLWPLASQSPARLFLVMAGRGGASYNNGLLLLPENGSLALLLHELSHAFGFIDEYAYSSERAERECRPGRLTANLIFRQDDLPAYLKKWRLSAAEVSLTPVATCGKQQAYKIVATKTHMQHYELAVPAIYIRLMKVVLEQPEQILPVSYYFAARARQAGATQQWQILMRHAAAQGYTPAQDALTQAPSLTAR
jgi:hypothetical protein